MKELHIICNSPQALDIISSGRFPDLHKRDLFTCNNAHTFFRTRKRHLNFFTDHFDIMRHLVWPEKLSDKYHEKIEHVFSQHGMKLANGTLPYRQLNYSPIEQGCSSGLAALAYATWLDEWDKIWFVGYTLDEGANPVWGPIREKYRYFEVRLNVFCFKKL